MKEKVFGPLSLIWGGGDPKISDEFVVEKDIPDIGWMVGFSIFFNSISPLLSDYFSTHTSCLHT